MTETPSPARGASETPPATPGPAASAGPDWRREIGDLGRSLVRFGPPVGPRWHLALQAAAAMSIPVLLLSILGFEQIALLAATGAFAVLYGGRLGPRERAAAAPVFAGALFASAAAGVGASLAGPGVVAGGLVLVAVLAAAASFGWSVGPPGPLFPVLLFGLSAHVVDPRSAGLDPALYLAVLAGSLALACAIVLVPLVRRRNRRLPARRLGEVLSGPRWDLAARTLVVRSAVVAAAGTALAVVVDPERAYWIVSAGIAVLGVSASRRAAVARGIHRALGSAVGAGLYLLLALIPLPPLALALVLGGLQFVIELVIVRHYALALAFITPLVLLILGSAGGGGAVVVERVVDTLVGSALGVLSGVIVLRARRV